MTIWITYAGNWRFVYFVIFCFQLKLSHNGGRGENLFTVSFEFSQMKSKERKNFPTTSQNWNTWKADHMKGDRRVEITSQLITAFFSSLKKKKFTFFDKCARKIFFLCIIFFLLIANKGLNFQQWKRKNTYFSSHLEGSLQFMIQMPYNLKP